MSRVLHRMLQFENMSYTFPSWISRQFVLWQAKQGERKTIDEFSAYLGVSRPLLNMWMNGNRKPGSENIKLLAEIFGNDVYDALDLPRPNPYLEKLNRVWEFLPEEIQKKFSEEAEKYETQNVIVRVQKVSKRRKTSKPE
jgi:transcriptional regulator with XRE-family HTH domain